MVDSSSRATHHRFAGAAAGAAVGIALANKLDDSGGGSCKYRGRDSKRAVDDAFRRVIKELDLKKAAQRRLHDEITGLNLTYEEILEIAKAMFR